MEKCTKCGHDCHCDKGVCEQCHNDVCSDCEHNDELDHAPTDTQG